MRGVLMIAHNNKLFDYGTLAYLSACLIRHHMGDPFICLMTDEETWDALLRKHPSAKELFLNPIFVSPGEENTRRFLVDGKMRKNEFRNRTRLQAYDYSPFEETLLIDSDVLVLDDRLNLCWGSNREIMINQTVGSLLPFEQSPSSMRIDDSSISMYWATVTYFKKAPNANRFFEIAKRVMTDFDYYGMLYKFPSGQYRNDFAFSVAAHITNGCQTGDGQIVCSLPIPYLPFAWEDDHLLDISRGKALFLAKKRYHMPVVMRQSVHCMNKKSILDNERRILDSYA